MNRFPFRLWHGTPFYLVSAACMLGGCLAINNSVPWISVPLPHDIILIATLNVYEIALIALAWHLIRCRRLIHDGAMLAALEAFFLVDITFLNAEVATRNLAAGLILNVVLFLAAVVKLTVLLRIVGTPIRDGRFAAMIVQLGALFTLPVIFRGFDHGDLSTFFFYGAWWVAGLLLPFCFAISQLRSGAERPPLLNGIVRLLCVLPWMSYVLHLGILHYVYNVRFYIAEIAAPLLGLACVLHHAKPSRSVSRRDLTTLQVLLSALAVLFSLTNPADLTIAFADHGRYSLSPAELGVSSAYLTLIYCFVRVYAIRFIVAGAIAAGAYLLGPTAQQISDLFSRVWNWIWDVAWTILPKTATDAGVAAITAAFAFLGLGAIASLRRREADVEAEPLENAQE